MVVVMEIRTSPANLEASFQRLGFDSYDYSEGRGYAKGICVAQNKDKIPTKKQTVPKKKSY